MKAIEYMQTWVSRGEKETDGPNRSPLIDEINTWLGVPLGSSYCAGSVSMAFHLAAKDGEPGKAFPYSAGSQSLLHSFEALGLVSEDPNDVLTWKGAIAGWTDPGGAHGHVFFIKERLTDATGKVVAFVTLEANTSPDGHSNNGIGFFERRRSPAEIMWYCDVSDMAGGDCWSA